jgi:hypothetical protein
MGENLYYAKLKPVVETALKTFEDGRVTLSEVWIFILVLGQAVEIVAEGSDLSDEDLVLMKDAGTQLYNEHVLPLDLPGPDWLLDPLLRGGILPGAIEAAFRLAKSKLAAKDGEE